MAGILRNTRGTGLAAAAVLSAAAAAAQTVSTIPVAAPLDPGFIQYQQKRAALRTAGAATAPEAGTHGLGLIPTPTNIYPRLTAVDPTALAPRVLRPMASASGCTASSASCDLRNSGSVNPVQDQGTCGDCWAFASLGAVESTLLANGQGNSCGGAGGGSACIFSENHLHNTDGFLTDKCGGGNLWMTNAYMTRGGGPVLTTSDPYCTDDYTSGFYDHYDYNTLTYTRDTIPCSASPTNLAAQKIVQNMIMVPNRSTPSDNAVIKAAIAAYGGVYTTVDAHAGAGSACHANAAVCSCAVAKSNPNWGGQLWCDNVVSGNDTAFNQSTNALYDYACSTTNHTVLIVGWDDNYPASSFVTNVGGNGAFLMKNQWGSNWAASGYFWMSYYSGFQQWNGSSSPSCPDPSVSVAMNGSAVFDLAQAPANPLSSAHTYSYDPDGYVSDYGYGAKTAWAANVFTSNSNTAENVSQVTFYTNDSNVAYSVWLYKSPAFNNPASGTSAFSPVTGTFPYAGYHTVNIPATSVIAGQKFSVVVKLVNSAYTYPVAVDNPVSGYSSGAPGMASGQSFLSSNGTAWTDFVSLGANMAASIKAVTSSRDPTAPTSAVTGLTAYALGVSSIQYTWNLLSDAAAYDVYYATNSLVALATAIQPPFVQTGLLPNQATGITVRGENLTLEGPGAFVNAATLASPPSSPPTATPFSSSATFAYSSCGAACTGYVVQVSPSPSFTGTVFSSATLSHSLLSLTVTGLSPLTGYYMRLGYLNPVGAASYAAPGAADGSFYTGTNLVAPNSPAFPQISTSVIVFSWGQSGNPAGITYSAQASTAADFSGTLQTLSGTAFSQSFSGLSADTSYYFRVQGLGGPTMTAGPTATLAAPPMPLANAFSAVASTSLTIVWSGNGNRADTLYQVQVAPGAGFTGAVTSQVRGPQAVVAGLSPNTLYYARVEEIGRAGGTNGYVLLGSTTTLLLPPTLSSAPFSAVATNGFTFSFNATDAPGTPYAVQVSADPTFTSVDVATVTAGNWVAIAGLYSNRYYSVRVAALNASGAPSPYAVSLPVATLVAAPQASPFPILTRAAASFGFQWLSGALSPGTTYLAQLSNAPSFASIIASTSTLGLNVTIPGLSANTTYYGRVQAVSVSANPSSAFLAAPAAATLPLPPSPGATTFLEVDYSSAIAAWTPLPSAPQSATAESYLLQFSTASDFSGTLFSGAAPAGSSRAVVTGLNYATQYYARVGSVGWEGYANYLTLGATVTVMPPLSSGTVSGGGTILSLPPAFSQLKAVSVYVPPGAFPQGTPLSAVANVLTLPPPVTNEAASITPFDSYVGLLLSAGGLQPSAPVTITMAYDPLRVPPGQNESRLQLWRYDAASLQWTLVPSRVDTTAHVLSAQTPHFSTFAPFFVAAGTDVGAAQVWPQPWEIGDPSSRYWDSVLHFSGLPADATAKIYTLSGELVWSGTASGAGTLSWDGNSRFGHKVVSGTYYLVFQNGGQTKTRRLVIVR